MVEEIMKLEGGWVGECYSEGRGDEYRHGGRFNTYWKESQRFRSPGKM